MPTKPNNVDLDATMESIINAKREDEVKEITQDAEQLALMDARNEGCSLCQGRPLYYDRFYKAFKVCPWCGSLYRAEDK